MQTVQSYVLVLGEQNSDELRPLEMLLDRLKCHKVIVQSTAQAMASVNRMPPYLVILSGRSWSDPLIHELRMVSDQCGVTIVALTDSHAPSWLHQEDHPGIDGFLVKPLHSDVLMSVVQSAWARRACCAPFSA